MLNIYATKHPKFGVFSSGYVKHILRFDLFYFEMSSFFFSSEFFFEVGSNLHSQLSGYVTNILTGTKKSKQNPK